MALARTCVSAVGRRRAGASSIPACCWWATQPGSPIAQSGEGIRPAIESGLLAAATIVEADGHYTRGRLAPYEERLRARFPDQPLMRLVARTIPSTVTASVAAWLFDSPAFVRHVLLDRWFLHADEPALSTTRVSPAEALRAE